MTELGIVTGNMRENVTGWKDSCMISIVKKKREMRVTNIMYVTQRIRAKVDVEIDGLSIDGLMSLIG